MNISVFVFCAIKQHHLESVWLCTDLLPVWWKSVLMDEAAKHCLSNIYFFCYLYYRSFVILAIITWSIETSLGYILYIDKLEKKKEEEVWKATWYSNHKKSLWPQFHTYLNCGSKPDSELKGGSHCACFFSQFLRCSTCAATLLLAVPPGALYCSTLLL